MIRLVVLLIIVGFPVALVSAWAFEMTPEGLKRTEVADAARTTVQKPRMDLCSLNRGRNFRQRCFFLDATPRQFKGEPRSPRKNRLPSCRSKISAAETGNAYFAEGIQDEILTRLAKIADLKVISRTSTQHFKSSPDNLTRSRQAAWRREYPGRQRPKGCAIKCGSMCN